MEIVTLGKSEIRTSRLCIGTGTSGWGGKSNQTGLGLDGLADLLCYAYDRGIRFWDSADQYGSHPHVRRALQRLDRRQVVVTTKTRGVSYADTAADVERFRREMDTDYLDIVLLHCLTEAGWPERFAGAMEALSEAQARGHVRAVGVSCHNFGAFQTAAVTPWVEIVLARINHAGLHMDASPAEIVAVMDRMHAADKGIYGMKVMGCGKLGDDPRRAVHYVLGLPCVDALVLGMMDRPQVDQNVALVEEFDGARARGGRVETELVRR
jgi:1-deoxyxylulose-5-phosphate synthase